MRFLVDEDLPTAVTHELVALGYEADHVREIGLGGKPDHDIFAAAQAREATLISADVGFGSIQRYPPQTHCGIIVLRFPDYFRRADIVRLACAAVSVLDVGALRGVLVTASPGSVRIRR